MSASTNVNVRMDSQLRNEFEQFCNEIGMSISTAVNVFARKAVREQKIPFEISTNSADTLEALNEVREEKNLNGPFDNVKDLMKDLNA